MSSTVELLVGGMGATANPVANASVPAESPTAATPVPHATDAEPAPAHKTQRWERTLAATT